MSLNSFSGIVHPFSGGSWRAAPQNWTELGGESAPNPIAGEGNALSQTRQVFPGRGAGTSFPGDPSVHKILAFESKRGKWMLGRKTLGLHYGVPLELGVVRLES